MLWVNVCNQAVDIRVWQIRQYFDTCLYNFLHLQLMFFPQDIQHASYCSKTECPNVKCKPVSFNNHVTVAFNCSSTFGSLFLIGACFCLWFKLPHCCIISPIDEGRYHAHESSQRMEPRLPSVCEYIRHCPTACKILPQRRMSCTRVWQRQVTTLFLKSSSIIILSCE